MVPTLLRREKPGELPSQRQVLSVTGGKIPHVLCARRQHAGTGAQLRNQGPLSSLANGTGDS